MRDYPSPQYPARCKRTHRVCELQVGESAVVAGRLAGRDSLSDETGTVRLGFNTADEGRAGDIVEVEGRLEGDVFHAAVLRVLVPSRSTAGAFNPGACRRICASVPKLSRRFAAFLMRRVLLRLRPL